MTSEAAAWASSLFPSSAGPRRQEGDGGRFEIGLDAGAGVREKKGQGALKQQKGERLCAAASPPSKAQNMEAWGNSAAHVQSTATRRPRP